MFSFETMLPHIEILISFPARLGSPERQFPGLPVVRLSLPFPEAPVAVVTHHPAEPTEFSKNGTSEACTGSHFAEWDLAASGCRCSGGLVGLDVLALESQLTHSPGRVKANFPGRRMAWQLPWDWSVQVLSRSLSRSRSLALAIALALAVADAVAAAVALPLPLALACSLSLSPSLSNSNLWILCFFVSQRYVNLTDS